MQRVIILKYLRYNVLEVDGKKYVIDCFANKWAIPLCVFVVFMKRKAYYVEDVRALNSAIKEQDNKLIYIALPFSILLSRLFYNVKDYFNLIISVELVTMINLLITVIVCLFIFLRLNKDKQSLEKTINLTDSEGIYVYRSLKNKDNIKLFILLVFSAVLFIAIVVFALMLTYLTPNLLYFAFYALAIYGYLTLSQGLGRTKGNDFIVVNKNEDN